jgi:hypothetical protein
MPTPQHALCTLALAAACVLAVSCRPPAANPPNGTVDSAPQQITSSGVTTPTSGSAAAAPNRPQPPTVVVVPPTSSTRLSAGALAFAGNTYAGMVQSVRGATITLGDGTGFRVSAQSSIIRTEPGTRANVQSGQFLGIDANPQPDGTLVGSTITVFEEVLRGVAPGQRTLESGAARVNCTLDEVRDTELTCSYPDDSVKVRLPNDVRVLVQVPGKVEDVKEGSVVFAAVNNGVATGVIIQ